MSRRQNKPKSMDPPNIKLAQPDRSAPSEETLLGLAQKEGLFDQAERREKEIRASKRKTGDKKNGDKSNNNKDDDDEGGLPSTLERAMDAILWGLSLATLHFTLDVLVQRQFAVALEWDVVGWRTCWAFLEFTFLIYIMHPHPSSPHLVPLLPARMQHPFHQALFFVVAATAGCTLIHLSNTYSYLYVMKRTPTLGCMWLWAVIELDLPLAVASLVVTGGYVVWGGYSLMGAI